MKLSIIAAMDEKRGIGKDNKLPWHIPEDLVRFKKLTTGHTIIMGRKTFESLGRPLPNRTNIVITRNPSFARSHLASVAVAHSFSEALRLASLAQGNDEIFVIGGGQIFAQALSLADKLYLTIVEGDYHADTFFPQYSQFTKVVFEQEGQSDRYKYKFLELEKTPS
ncbi:dihydrofolate reductase [Candidatus Microgenomates bacterium]|nr:dihydrofolate reductase [Candidatus Microgenomates bacterium]